MTTAGGGGTESKDKHTAGRCLQFIPQRHISLIFKEILGIKTKANNPVEKWYAIKKEFPEYEVQMGLEY